LRILKDRLGDRVQIVSAGAKWDPREFDLKGVVENLGLIRPDVTNSPRHFMV